MHLELFCQTPSNALQRYKPTLDLFWLHCTLSISLGTRREISTNLSKLIRASNASTKIQSFGLALPKQQGDSQGVFKSTCWPRPAERRKIPKSHIISQTQRPWSPLTPLTPLTPARLSLFAQREEKNRIETAATAGALKRALSRGSA